MQSADTATCMRTVGVCTPALYRQMHCEDTEPIVCLEANAKFYSQIRFWEKTRFYKLCDFISYRSYKTGFENSTTDLMWDLGGVNADFQVTETSGFYTEKLSD